MKPIATFSIVGRDPKTAELGIAVQSKFLSVGSAVPWAKAGAGAIATQSFANLDYGELGLKLLEKGYSAQETLDALLATDKGREERQVGIVDAQGRSVTFTGKKCFDWAGGLVGENFACQGNILVSEETVTAMRDVFLSTDGPLSRRLVMALDAGQNAGGDKRGRQSASLLVVKEKGSYGGFNDRYIDLRVDDHQEPIKELLRILDLHEMYFNRTTEEEKLAVDRDVATKIQTALKRLGFYKGEADGIYNDATKEAYKDFCGIENFEERMLEGDFVDSKVLDFLVRKQ